MFKFNKINTRKTLYNVSILCQHINQGKSCKHIFASWVFRPTSNFLVAVANFVADRLRVNTTLVLQASQNGTTPLRSKKWGRAILKCILKSVDNIGRNEEAVPSASNFFIALWFLMLSKKSVFICTIKLSFPLPFLVIFDICFCCS